MTAREAPARLVLLGHPVTHSLSPRFQNAALLAAHMPQRYEAVDVDAQSLPALLQSLASERAAGNVTIPHKEAVAALASRRTPLAERVGAVNTFWFENGALVGHNTDVIGVEAALAALLGGDSGFVRGMSCAVLGAGGSAAAVLVALDRLGAGDIRMWSRTTSRVQALATRVGVSVTACGSADDAVRGAHLVINATPVGLHADEFPIAPSLLNNGASVFDLVYRSGETAWVRACRARSLSAQDGLRMLVEQGAAAFEAWFGVAPSRDAMWSALEPRA